MRLVRILGMAPNLSEMGPSPNDCEVWASNSPEGYRKRCPIALQCWTRWFNLHSRAHMQSTYPRGLRWYIEQDGTHPIYTQTKQQDIPGNVIFPGAKIQASFPLKNGLPTRYFTCSVTWLIAFAIMEGFDKIELWGFRLSDRKPGERYAYERPCFFYWVKQARDRGIDVWYQKEIDKIPFLPGAPDTYTGPLYGYETKPEPTVRHNIDYF